MWLFDVGSLVPRVEELCDKLHQFIMSSLGSTGRSFCSVRLKRPNLYSSIRTLSIHCNHFSVSVLRCDSSSPTLLHRHMQKIPSWRHIRCTQALGWRSEACCTGKPWDSFWFPFTVFSFKTFDQKHNRQTELRRLWSFYSSRRMKCLQRYDNNTASDSVTFMPFSAEASTAAAG